jgi:dextranase
MTNTGDPIPLSLISTPEATPIMNRTELLPMKSLFAADEPVAIELRGAQADGELVLRHLGTEIARVPIAGDATTLGVLAPGGYGVELVAGGAVLARTAVQVVGAEIRPLRYGFVVDYSPDRDVSSVSDLVRRLHLTGVQFYDWAYRHADLLGGGQQYLDALGQPVALDTVRRLVQSVRQAGAHALGYAAVYAVGPQEWDGWRHDALKQGDGTDYGLGDFLFLVDPASPDWLAHFRADLAASTAAVGFDGYHLDQYGYPKVARRADGAVVNVGDSFGMLIRGVRDELPTATLVFNNVNDFPTWSSGGAPQDAVYIEVWDPHVTLGSLGAVVSRARAVGEGKPVVIAAYQHVYDSAPAVDSDRATALTMATLYSHGATQLLAGEADRILVDPYYVRNHEVESSTADLLKRWYDFLVEHYEILMTADAADVTGSFAGPYNDDLDVRYADTAVTGEAVAGAVWRRIVSTGDRYVMHLINLSGQADTLWDGAKAAFGAPGEATLRLRAVEGAIPRVRVADPDRGGYLVDVEVRVEGTHAIATLPEPTAWQVVVVDLAEDVMEAAEVGE